MNKLNVILVMFKEKWLAKLVCLAVLLLTVVIPSSTSATSCVEPPSGLVAWWPGDGHPYDLVSGYHTTPQNGAGYAAGTVEQAFSLDGTDDWFHAPGTSSIDILQTLTIELWVQHDTLTPGMIQRYITLTGEKAVLRYTDPEGGGMLHFYMNFGEPEPGGFDLHHIWVPGIIQAGVSHHVAGTYDGSMMRLYLDGVEVGNHAVSGTVSDGLGVELGSEYPEALDGWLDEVTIYDRALSASEIGAIYAAGSAGKCKPLPKAVSAVSAWLENPVTLDGQMSSADEWAEADPVQILLDRVWGWPDRQVEEGAAVLVARFKNDGEWLYLLYQVPWDAAEVDLADGAFIELFCFGGCPGWDINDSGNLGQDQETGDNYEWDGSRWLRDADYPPGENNVEGAASYDGTAYWYEFRKRLNSGDTRDWQLAPGQLVGSSQAPVLPPHLMVGVWDATLASTYEQYLTLQLDFDNSHPVARASISTEAASFGQSINLYGASSSDPDGDTLSFLWEVVDGPSATLIGTDQATASFVAPAIVGTWTLRLTVTDQHGASSSDTVQVTVFEDLENAIFVSASLGDDDPQYLTCPLLKYGLGSRQVPVQTLDKAVELALENDPPADIYVHAGSYWLTGELPEGASLYGGFEAFESSVYCPLPFPGDYYPVADGWTRTASDVTHILGGLRIKDVTTLSTVIDGFTIEAGAGTSGRSQASVAGQGFYIRRRAYYPVTKVWLSDMESPVSWDPDNYQLTGPGTTLVMDPLSTDPYACIPTVYLPDYHDAEKELRVDDYWWIDGPPYMVSYLEAAMQVSCPGLIYYDENTASRTATTHFAAIAPGTSYLDGYDLVRETLFLFQYGFYQDKRFEQVYRGSNGVLYLYRPGMYPCDKAGIESNWTQYVYNRNLSLFYPWDGYVGVEGPFYESINWNACHGPVELTSYLQQNPYSPVYDLTLEGTPGSPSIGIWVTNSNNNLRITNNLIVTGVGGNGGVGGDYFDGGEGGDGGDGGDSVGIRLYDASPRIAYNTFVIGGGGAGGATTSPSSLGGDGGDSCGIMKLGDSAPWQSGNTFQLGPAGSGGMPAGEEGQSAGVCPSRELLLAETPLLPSATYVTSVMVSYEVHQAAFFSRWLGSDVEMSLVSPSGRLIDRTTSAPDVVHLLTPTSESYTISQPEPGSWQVILYGADLPPDGETVSVMVTEEPANQLPLAEAGGPYLVAVNVPIHLDGSGSADPDGALVSWEWDMDVDGDWDDAAGVAPLFQASAAGIYRVNLRVTDNSMQTGSDETEVVVYDPSAGFVTGGGWFNSDPGDYRPDPLLAGKASFGFVSKYTKNGDLPSGETEFQFGVADFGFHSTSYEWLVVAPSYRAIFKGEGQVNGEPGYGFMLWAVDGDIAGDNIDRFRIKIWLKETDEVVYDNESLLEDNSVPTTPVVGGAIVIHTSKVK